MPIRIRVQQVLILLLALALAGAMVVLGIWQLRVYTAQGSAAAERRAAAPPVPLRSVAPAGAAGSDGYGRTVTVDGRYDSSLQVLVPVSDRGPYRVLTALRQDDGSVVAVVRGLVDAGPAPAAPSGVLHQTGVLLPSEEAAPGGPASPGQLGSVRLPLLAQTVARAAGRRLRDAVGPRRPGPAPDPGDAQPPRGAADGCATARTRSNGGCSPDSPW